MEWGRQSVPANEFPQGQASPSGEPASAPSPQRDGRYFLGLLTVYLVFFSLAGLVFSSQLPIDIGAFLLLTDGELIEWLLQKAGVRFVPGTLGREFIRVFAFLIGLWVLLFYWRDSAPAWLSPWLPPDASWSVLVGAAFAAAAFNTVRAAVRRTWRDGVAFSRHSLDWALFGFAAVGLLGVLVSLLLFWIGPKSF